MADRGHGRFDGRKTFLLGRAVGGDAKRDRGLAGRDADRRTPAAADQVGQHRLDLALAGRRNNGAAGGESRGGRAARNEVAIAAATESCHISIISAGTPGRQITRHGGRSSRGTSRSMPGAVPCGFRTTRLPAGNIAWSSFCGGIGRLRRANIRRMCCQRVGVELQRAAGGSGQRLASQIIGRGAKPAGGHDDVGPIDRLAKHFDARAPIRRRPWYDTARGRPTLRAAG